MKEKIKNCNEEKYIINKEDIIKVENIIKEECELFDVLEKNEIEIKFVVNENKATIKYERESGEFLKIISDEDPINLRSDYIDKLLITLNTAKNTTLLTPEAP